MRGIKCVYTRVSVTDLVLDQGREGQVVKEVCEELPDVGVSIFAEALVVEPVDLGDLARLVVAAKNRHAVPVTKLGRDEKRDSLNGAG